ncbi:MULTISPECIES: hypothetical protein [Mycobacterium]|uniref:hypothetical protein n=1 Tax=Mycobacterium TaxID=1763 RepID=UPI000A83FD21|nr:MULTISPECIES: hypothetical protein [Mycobacterium]MDP7731258.1 hypothetical protein [Mycobacterium sp. TY813]
MKSAETLSLRADSVRSGEWHGRGGASAAGPDDNDVDGFNGLTGTAGSNQRGLQYR